MSKLVGDNGRPNFGLHKGPIRELNIGDFRAPGDSKSAGSKGKSWIFLGVSNAELVFGIAVVNLGYLSNAFSYVYDRRAKKLGAQNDIIVPFGFNTKFTGSSLEGRVNFGRAVSVSISQDEIKMDAILPGVAAKLVFFRLKESLNAVTKNGIKGFNYTNKEAGLAVEGFIRTGSKEYEISKMAPSGSFDYTLGVLKRNTYWNWASGGGVDLQGRKLGFNLAAGVNETGFTENAFWVDGRMVKVDSVDFIYDDRNMLSDWKIRSFDGKVDINFTPEAERAKNLDMGFIVSRYHQPFGAFTGTFSDGAETYALKEVYGFTEEHEAVW